MVIIVCIFSNKKERYIFYIRISVKTVYLNMDEPIKMGRFRIHLNFPENPAVNGGK